LFSSISLPVALPIFGHFADTRLYGKQPVGKVPFFHLGFKKPEQVPGNGHRLPVRRGNIRRTVLDIRKHNGCYFIDIKRYRTPPRSEEHTSELQSREK